MSLPLAKAVKRSAAVRWAPKLNKGPIPLRRVGNVGRQREIDHVSKSPAISVDKLNPTKDQYRHPSTAIATPSATPIAIEPTSMSASDLKRICRLSRA